MTPEEREAAVEVMAFAMFDCGENGMLDIGSMDVARMYAGYALDALLAPRKVCETCGGDGQMWFGALLGNGPCPDCTDGTVTVDSPLVERGRLEQVGVVASEPTTGGARLSFTSHIRTPQKDSEYRVYVLRPEEEQT